MRGVLSIIHSIIYNKCPHYFFEYIKKNEGVHLHNTRGKEKITTSLRINNKYGERLLNNVALKFWNSLPENVTLNKNKTAFSQSIKDHLLQNQVVELVLKKDRQTEKA